MLTFLTSYQKSKACDGTQAFFGLTAGFTRSGFYFNF